MNQKQDSSPFYVGYMDKAPTAIASFIKPRVAILLVFSLVLGLVFAFSQAKFAASFFEFGNYQTFEGSLITKPYPMLLVDRPNSTSQTHFYVVAFGKNGGQKTLDPFHGKRVSMEAQLIYRDDQTMIEFKDGSIKALSDAPPPPGSTLIGDMTLRGEIVDSKCYLGVMKPGEGKAHKACAIRCIDGGIPPVFVVRDTNGDTHYFLLTDEDGSPVNKAVLPYVAEPLEIKGRVEVSGDLYMLKASPSVYKRL